MDTNDILNKVLQVKRGEKKLADFNNDDRSVVARHLRSVPSSQLSRLAHAQSGVRKTPPGPGGQTWRVRAS